MSVNINLAGDKDPAELKKERNKKLKNASIVVLILTAFLAIIIFAIDFRFSASYVKKQETDLLKELDTYNDVASKMFIVNNKLSDISTILEGRSDFSEKIDKIIVDSESDVVIREFEVSESGILLTVGSDSIDEIDDFLNYLLKLNEEKFVSSLKLNSLRLNDTGVTMELLII